VQINACSRLFKLEEALKFANEFAVKLNPYLLYHGVKTPSQLVVYFGGQIKALRKELEEERNQDENALAARLGINPLLAQTVYQILRKTSNFSGTLGDFINTCIVTFLQVFAKTQGLILENVLKA